MNSVFFIVPLLLFLSNIVKLSYQYLDCARLLADQAVYYDKIYLFLDDYDKMGDIKINCTSNFQITNIFITSKHFTLFDQEIDFNFMKTNVSSLNFNINRFKGFSLDHSFYINLLFNTKDPIEIVIDYSSFDLYINNTLVNNNCTSMNIFSNNLLFFQLYSTNLYFLARSNIQKKNTALTYFTQLV